MKAEDESERTVSADARESLLQRLCEELGERNVLSEPEDLGVYAFDAYSEERLPVAVVLPENSGQVCALVRIAAAFGQPLVPRGAGPGLCGGAVPVAGGIVVSFARMNRILELDVVNRRARVQPGVVNLDLSKAAQPYGLFFGPDPSSQKTSTLGGNAATNAGGPHAFSYGSMTNHVLGVEYVRHDGGLTYVS